MDRATLRAEGEEDGDMSPANEVTAHNGEVEESIDGDSGVLPAMDTLTAAAERSETGRLQAPKLGGDGMDLAARKAAINDALAWLRQEMKSMRNEGSKLKIQFNELSLQVHSMKLDAIHFKNMAMKRMSSVSFNGAELMDYSDDITNDELPSPDQPNFFSLPRFQRLTNRTASMPHVRRAISARNLNYKLKDCLPSPTEEFLPQSESTPLRDRLQCNGQTTPTFGSNNETIMENGTCDDMPSPKKQPISPTDGCESKDTEVAQSNSAQREHAETSTTVQPQAVMAPTITVSTTSSLVEEENRQEEEQLPDTGRPQPTRTEPPELPNRKNSEERKKSVTFSDHACLLSDTPSPHVESPTTISTSDHKLSPEASSTNNAEHLMSGQHNIFARREPSIRRSRRRLNEQIRKKYRMRDHQQQQVFEAAKSMGIDANPESTVKPQETDSSDSKDSQAGEKTQASTFDQESVSSLSGSDHWSSRSSSPTRSNSTSSHEPSGNMSKPQSHQGTRNDSSMPENQQKTRNIGTSDHKIIATTRTSSVGHQMQQVWAAAIDLGLGKEVQTESRPDSFCDTDSSQMLTSDSQPPTRTTFNSTPSVDPLDTSESLLSVRDISGYSMSPSGMIRQRMGSPDASLASQSRRWSKEACGSLPSVRDIDSTSPSGRIHQQRNSADFSFLSGGGPVNIERRESAPASPSGSAGNLTEYGTNGSTKWSSRDVDHKALPKRVTVQRSQSANCKLSSSQRPFWPTVGQLEIGLSPSYPRQSRCSSQLYRPQSELNSPGSYAFHQRTGSSPEVSLERTGTQKGHSQTSQMSHPSSTGSHLLNNAHIRHHSADFDIPDQRHLMPIIPSFGQGVDNKNINWDRNRPSTLPRKFRVPSSVVTAVSQRAGENAEAPQLGVEKPESWGEKRYHSLPRNARTKRSYRVATSQEEDDNDICYPEEDVIDGDRPNNSRTCNQPRRKPSYQQSYRIAVGQNDENDDIFTALNPDDQEGSGDCRARTLPRTTPREVKASYRAAISLSVDETGGIPRNEALMQKRHSSPLMFLKHKADALQQQKHVHLEHRQPSLSTGSRPSFPLHSMNDPHAIALHRAQEAAAASPKQQRRAPQLVAPPTAASSMPKSAAQSPSGSLDIFHGRQRKFGQAMPSVKDFIRTSEV